MKASELCQTALNAGLSKYGKIKYNNSYPYNVLYWHIAENYWTCDCLGFVHTLVNGTVFNRDINPGGGAVMDDFVNYSDEMSTLMNYCTNVSGDFTKIVPGELLYMSGHVGLYIGEHEPFNDGRFYNVSECCKNSFGGGGMLTWVDTNGIRRNQKGGTTAGAWTRHGKFKRVEYDSIKPEPITPGLTPAEILNVVNDTFIGIYGCDPERREKLTQLYGAKVHRQVQDILNILYQ